MKRVVMSVCVVAGCLISFVLLANVKVRAGHDDRDDRDRDRDSRVATGFRIIPSRCISSTRIVRRWVSAATW